MNICNKCNEMFEGKACKPCRAKYMREWSRKNPEKIKTIKKKTYFKNKKKDNERSKNWAKKNRCASNAIKKAWKERNREKYLAQQREYAKKRYIENAEKISEQEKPPKRLEILKKWHEKNRERLNAKYLQKYHESEDMKMKNHARNKVYRAIKCGKLMKSSECSKCASKDKIQAHHLDYSKPLEVIWLCTSCHKKVHSKYLNKQEAI